MRYVFLFNGGPLDGNAFHGDDESSPLAICSDAHRTFEETKNTGRTGIRFEMPNIDTPKDENGTFHRFIPHIYETTTNRTSPSDRIVITAKHIRAGTLEGASDNAG